MSIAQNRVTGQKSWESEKWIILSNVTGAFYDHDGVMKFLPSNPPIFQIIENNVGLDFINPAFKYLTALLEIVAGILLFVNRPRGRS